MLIYISHLTPIHDRPATDVKSALGIPADVKVVCSHDYQTSQQIQKDHNLQDADFLIVLLPLTDVDMDLFSVGVEVGRYLQICAAEKKLANVICLHDENIPAAPLNQIRNNAPDAQVTLYPANGAGVTNLLDTLYSQQGDILDNDARVNSIKNEVLLAFGFIKPSERHTTGVLLTLTISEIDWPTLETGKVPSDALVGGYLWEELMGLPQHTAGLTWEGVADSLQDSKLWEPILAEELVTVRTGKSHRRSNVVPILLKNEIKNQPSAAVVQGYDVFEGVLPEKRPDDASTKRDGLSKADATSTRQHRFSLVAFQSPLLFDPGDPRLVASAYHLAVVSQLFRFTVVDTDLKELERINALKSFEDKIEDIDKRKRTAVADLRRHLLLIDVECRRRGFLNRAADFNSLAANAFEDALNANKRTISEISETVARAKTTPGNVGDVQLAEAQKQLTEAQKDRSELDGRRARLAEIFGSNAWNIVLDQLNKQIAVGTMALEPAIGRLKELAAMNASVIRFSAETYARLAQREYSE